MKQFCRVAIIVAVLPVFVHASAFVSGAWYRLGEDDPGAAAGNAGNAFTLDSFSDHLDLARTAPVSYSADVSAKAPSALSMQFGVPLLPTVPGYYSRSTPLPMNQQGYSLEAWVKPASAAPTGGLTSSLIAYNGNPTVDGFGLFEVGSDYVAQVGKSQFVLGPAEAGVWHHIAYIHNFSDQSYYYDGHLVRQSTTDPDPLAATTGFFIGGTSSNYHFTGWIDEVRYQSFNPLAAGVFNPDSFLITVPEPAVLSPLLLSALLLRRYRRPGGR